MIAAVTGISLEVKVFILVPLLIEKFSSGG